MKRYEEAARIRDENSFCYLNTVPKLDEKPIQGSCNDSTIEQAAEKTNKIDKNINVEKRYSSGALNVMDKSRCGKRKQIDDSIPLNNDLVHFYI